jgi:hypothetical protein
VGGQLERVARRLLGDAVDGGGAESRSAYSAPRRSARQLRQISAGEREWPLALGDLVQAAISLWGVKIRDGCAGRTLIWHPTRLADASHGFSQDNGAAAELGRALQRGPKREVTPTDRQRIRPGAFLAERELWTSPTTCQRRPCKSNPAPGSSSREVVTLVSWVRPFGYSSATRDSMLPPSIGNAVPTRPVKIFKQGGMSVVGARSESRHNGEDVPGSSPKP